MAGGGGGFGYGYGYGYGYLHNKPSLYRPSPPPLTAIERFLLGSNHFPPHQSETQNKETLIPSTGHLGNFFSSSGGAIGSSCINGFSWRSTTTTHAENYNPFPDHRERCSTTIDWSYERILEAVGLKEENNNSPLRDSEEVRRRTKGDSSETIIKGQWTDEEDRNLLMLVRMYGVKKWAQIAEKMVGRAGKQCRERWHNHLRPDIKKDGWSEEEERLLVETHKEVGNKWAEIAKRIPRRTENSIKNHWNATKRRQNSKRRIKKPQSQNGKPISTILQDYIKSKIMSEGSSSNIVTPTQSTTNDSTLDSDQFNLSLADLSESSSSIDDPSQLITNQTHNDELNFMINFFGEKKDPPQSNEKKPIQTEDTRMNVSALNIYLGFNKTNGDQMLNVPETNMFLNNTPVEEEQPRSTYLSSDLYLSNLLEEQNGNLPTDCYYDNMKVGSQASPLSGKKEMDLMEMIASSSSSSASQFSLSENSKFLF